MKRVLLFLALAGIALGQQNTLQKLTIVNVYTGQREVIQDDGYLWIKGEPYYVEQFTLGSVYGFTAPSPIPTPTAAPTATPTPTPQPTPPSPTPTPATPTPSPSPTASQSPNPSPTPTPTPTASPSPSPTATATPSASPTITPPSPTVTPSPSTSPSGTTATVAIINPTQGDTYDIYYGRAIGKYGPPVPIPRGQSSVVITGLTKGNKYYFTSITTRLGQSSAMSDPIQYTPGISKTAPNWTAAILLLLLMVAIVVVLVIRSRTKEE